MNAARDARIRQLVAEGSTASEIAREVEMSSVGAGAAISRLGLVAFKREPKPKPESSASRGVRLCDLEGCGGKHLGKGYCKPHLRRLRLYGDPLGGARLHPDLEGAAFGGVWDAIEGGSAVWACGACERAYVEYGDGAAARVRMSGERHQFRAHSGHMWRVR